MRKLMAMILVLALPLSALATTYATVVASDVLYLRDEPSTDGEVIGRYRHGTRGEILNSTKYRNWAKVRVGGLEGYMYKSYLSVFATEKGSSGSSSGSARL